MILKKIKRNSKNKQICCLYNFLKRIIGWLNMGLIDTALESRARKKATCFIQTYTFNLLIT